MLIHSGIQWWGLVVGVVGEGYNVVRGDGAVYKGAVLAVFGWKPGNARRKTTHTAVVWEWRFSIMVVRDVVGIYRMDDLRDGTGTITNDRIQCIFLELYRLKKLLGEHR